MKKRYLSAVAVTALSLTIGLAACNAGNKPSSDGAAQTQESEVAATTETTAEKTTVDGSAYGYAGTDPVEATVYQYMVEEVGKSFEKADVSIPVVSITYVDQSNPNEVVVYGDFWINNYNIKGDTLECVSGGNFPGVMHLTKSGDTYVVSSFDRVADGSNYESSARELFGEHYDDFAKVQSDDKARAELRTKIVSDYVRMNGLEVTKYQDYGWDPVELNK